MFLWLVRVHMTSLAIEQVKYSPVPALVSMLWVPQMLQHYDAGVPPTAAPIATTEYQQSCLPMACIWAATPAEVSDQCVMCM